MTFERKIVVGLEDICSVSFQCEKCAYKVTVSPDKIGGLPPNCPEGHAWAIGVNGGTASAPLRRFTDALATLRLLAGQKALGFRVQFEFDEPADK